MTSSSNSPRIRVPSAPGAAAWEDEDTLVEDARRVVARGSWRCGVELAGRAQNDTEAAEASRPLFPRESTVRWQLAARRGRLEALLAAVRPRSVRT